VPPSPPLAERPEGGALEWFAPAEVGSEWAKSPGINLASPDIELGSPDIDRASSVKELASPAMERASPVAGVAPPMAEGVALAGVRTTGVA